jgi:uncharacterized protein YfaS (alpha-2-macroglobulin family)
MARYDIGDLARITATFTQDANPIDPTTITAEVRDPDGIITEVPTTLQSPGIYRALVDLTASGQWGVRIYSTGTGQAAEEILIKVERSFVLDR